MTEYPVLFLHEIYKFFRLKHFFFFREIGFSITLIVIDILSIDGVGGGCSFKKFRMEQFGKSTSWWCHCFLFDLHVIAVLVVSDLENTGVKCFLLFDKRSLSVILSRQSTEFGDIWFSHRLQTLDKAWNNWKRKWSLLFGNLARALNIGSNINCGKQHIRFIRGRETTTKSKYYWKPTEAVENHDIPSPDMTWQMI